MSAIRASGTKRARRAARLTASFICFLGLAPLALAQRAGAPPNAVDADDGPRLELVQRGGVSLQQAVAIATRRYNGRVVRAETIVRNGRTVHEIRLIDEENRVRTVHIDADSGEVR